MQTLNITFNQNTFILTEHVNSMATMCWFYITQKKCENLTCVSIYILQLSDYQQHVLTSLTRHLLN